MSAQQNRTLSAIVERQMRNWELARQQSSVAPEPDAPEVKPFVTISRMVGSGGEAVAQQLAEHVSWPLFDREVLHEMAGDDAVRERLYASLDERDVGFVEESARAFTSPEFKRNDYFHQLTRTIFAIVRKGNAIFLGRGADLILPRQHGLRVRIVSLPAACAQNYAATQGIDAVRAVREIEHLEQQRTRFIEGYFNVERDAQDRHDVTINLASVSAAESVHVITEIIRLRAMIR